MINSHALLFMLGGIFMTHEQFKKAADYWKNKEMTAMPKEELKKAVEEYIASNNTCALATGTGDYVRCTPIEYSYHNDKFWMFSEGGEKFIGLVRYILVSCMFRGRRG